MLRAYTGAADRKSRRGATLSARVGDRQDHATNGQGEHGARNVRLQTGRSAENQNQRAMMRARVYYHE